MVLTWILSSNTRLFATALVVRVLLLVYGEWQNAVFHVAYTDIDYVVYTDAARAWLSSASGSPYDRTTYRYSPLMAMLMAPNVVLHPICGKLLFVVCDLLAGVCIYFILAQQKQQQQGKERWSALQKRKMTALWLLNPLVINISTRGSADVLVTILVFVCVLCVLRQKLLLGGLMFGLAVHFKLYPVIYSLSFVWFLFCNNNHNNNNHNNNIFFCQRVRHVLLFAGSAVLSFCVLLLVFYWQFGWVFVYETYIYHLVRKDVRHNFSVYFYANYLSSSATSVPSSSSSSSSSSWFASYFFSSFSVVSSVLWTIMGAWMDGQRWELVVLKFLPLLLQAWLVVVFTFRFAQRDLCFCMLLQTFVFVHFNKVVTAQYFVWFVSLWSVAMPSLVFGASCGEDAAVVGGADADGAEGRNTSISNNNNNNINSGMKPVLQLVGCWLVSELLWLLCAYFLEFQGRNTFLYIWIASLVFFVVHVWLAHRLIQRWRHVQQQESTAYICTEDRVKAE